MVAGLWLLVPEDHGYLRDKQAQCLGAVAKEKGVALAFDAAGVIPGVGPFTSFGMSVAGVLASSFTGDSAGVLPAVGGTFLSLADVCTTYGLEAEVKAIPFAGNVYSLYFLGKDPVPVGGPGTGSPLKLAWGNKVGTIAGRLAPWAGMATTAYSLYELNKCLGKRP